MGGAPGVDEGIAVRVATAEAKLIEETLGCPVAAVHTPVGSRAGGILAAAAAVGAGLVVVGGRHLGIVEELFIEPERALEAAARTLAGTTTVTTRVVGATDVATALREACTSLAGLALLAIGARWSSALQWAPQVQRLAVGDPPHPSAAAARPSDCRWTSSSLATATPRTRFAAFSAATNCQ